MQMTRAYSAVLKTYNLVTKKYTLSQELQKVYKWLLANKLKLNVAKTKYMIFSKRNKNINPIYLNINNNVIEHVH